jgi:hypothetical protein
MIGWGAVSSAKAGAARRRKRRAVAKVFMVASLKHEVSRKKGEREG